MNSILKAVLKVGEQVAVQAVPGANIVDAAVHGLVEHKGTTDANILQAVQGVIETVEAIKGSEIVDQAKFAAACATLDAGFNLLKESLTPPTA